MVSHRRRIARSYVLLATIAEIVEALHRHHLRSRRDHLLSHRDHLCVLFAETSLSRRRGGLEINSISGSEGFVNANRDHM